MCGRFVSARKRAELLKEFEVERDAVAADRDPDYNVAPTKRIYAVLDRAQPESESAGEGTGEGTGTAPGSRTDPRTGPRPEETGPDPAVQRELRLVRWGLVPFWAKDTKGGSRMINARAETVASKPAFRAAFARRRCLIPADGYYEWQAEGKEKKPFYIRRADGGVLAFAGLYELWHDRSVPDDDENAWYWSATIITTDATDEVGRIHDRTPMVVAPGDWADWLDPALTDKEHLFAAMRPATLGGLTSFRVAPAVNSVRNNGPALIEPLAGEPAGELSAS
jgi:putative SOS response-associated peptidase YedK